MKSSLFHKIFDTDKNHQFTVKSRRLQVILVLLNDHNTQYYTLRHMQNEIYSKYPEIYKFDHKTRKKGRHATPSEKAERGYDTFKNYVEQMVDSRLIRSRVTKSEKNTTSNIKEFQITNTGKLLALIVEYMNSPNDNKIQNKLYSFCQSYFNSRPYSLDIFCSDHFKRIKEAGLLKDFLEFVKIGIIENFHHFHNLNNLFTHIILSRTPDKQKNKVLLDLWLESYDSLDSHNLELFTYHLKIYINRIIQTKVSEYASFEQERFSAHIYDDVVVTEFSCLTCHSCYYLSTKISLYITFLFRPDDLKLVVDQISELKCTKCNSNSFKILMI